MTARGHKIQYPIAIDEKGAVVRALPLKRESIDGHIYRCHLCGELMRPALGKHNTNHFRHLGSPCKYEDWLHKGAARLFIQEFQTCLDNDIPFYYDAPIQSACNHACLLKGHENCSAHIQTRKVDLTKKYVRVYLEKTVNVAGADWRPDILLESEDGKQLWVEIFVTHSDARKKNKASIIEIKIDSVDDYAVFYNHYLKASERIQSYNIDFFEPVKSIIHPPCDNVFVYSNNGKRSSYTIDEGLQFYLDSNHPPLAQSFVCAMMLNKAGGHYNEVSSRATIIPSLTTAELTWILDQRSLFHRHERSIFSLSNEASCFKCIHRKTTVANKGSRDSDSYRQCDYCSHGLSSEGNPFGPAIYCNKKQILPKNAPANCYSFKIRSDNDNEHMKTIYCEITQNQVDSYSKGCENYEPTNSLGLIPNEDLFSFLPSDRKICALIELWNKLTPLILFEEVDGRRSFLKTD